MSIIRVHKTSNYSVVSNVPLTDRRLSWDHRGMMAYLLSRPDGWQISMAHLINESPDGRDKVKRIIRELAGFGYIRRTRESGAGGKFFWLSTVYEIPQEETIAGKTVDGRTVDGKPVDIINTDPANTITNDSKESLVSAQESSPDQGQLPSPEKKQSEKNRLSEALIDSFCKELGWKIKPGKNDNLVNGWVNPLLRVYAQFGSAFGLFEVKENGMPGEYVMDEYTVWCTSLAYQRARAKHVNGDGSQLSMKSPDSLTYLINELLPGFIQAAVQQRAG